MHIIISKNGEIPQYHSCYNNNPLTLSNSCVDSFVWIDRLSDACTSLRSTVLSCIDPSLVGVSKLCPSLLMLVSLFNGGVLE